MGTKILTDQQRDELIDILKSRFEKNMQRHSKIDWAKVEQKLDANPQKMWSLYEMERTGGEPDLTGYDRESDYFLFCDCSPESPAGRRNLCYDGDALKARKENKPTGNAMDTAAAMGIELLTEDRYRELQTLGQFDRKSSSWLKTPDEVRKAGGALFGDFRYGMVFIYHNGAESYYAARGFRGMLRL